MPKIVTLLFTPDFRSGFKRLVEDYRQVVVKKIDECLKLKDSIDKGDARLEFRKKVFRRIVNQVNVQGRRTRVADRIMEKIEGKQQFKEWLPKYFHDEDSEGIKMLNDFSDRKKENVIKISRQLKGKSIADWVKDLHKSRKCGEKPRMGPKSDDDFLKELGFFDRVPIDVNTQRFLFRTGILHYYNKKEELNPKFLSANYYKRYESFQNALVSFCHDFLSGIEIKGFDLGENPGIADLIIWRHCAKRNEKYGCREICGDKPLCGKCSFNGSCLLYLLDLPNTRE